MDVQVTLSKCIRCGAKLDGATGLETEYPEPSPGDVSICAYCSNIAIYGDDLRLRTLTKDEWLEIGKDGFVTKAVEVSKKFQQQIKEQGNERQTRKD